MAGERDSDDDSQNNAQKPTPLRWKCLDFGWQVFTWPGRFKSAEFVTTFLGFVLVATVNVFDEEPRYEFYVFVGVFSWVIVFVHLILGILHVIEKLPLAITQPVVFFALCSLAVLTWLIAASVVVAKDRDNAAIQAGAVFGYITMFLFSFEAVYYFVLWRRGGSARKADQSKEMEDTAGGSGDYVADELAY